jgi:hypothetical protein
MEIEYEGEQSFIEESLLTFAERLLELGDRIPLAISASVNSHPEPKPSRPELSTNTIAQIIAVKTGSDLALAAVAKINIVKGQSTASRSEILDEMKQASTYYKDTFASNLSSYLDTLVKSRRINMVSKATYALAASERGRMEQAISSYE